jgi:Protein of unknown function (DUF3617)
MKCFVFLLVALGTCTAQAQSLDLKTGAWEITTSGGPMRRPLVEGECVTKADLAQFSTGPDKDDDAECKYDRPPTVSAKTWSAEKSCPGGRKMRVEFTAEGPERVKGSVTILPGNNSSTMTVQISGRWLAASCKP